MTTYVFHPHIPDKKGVSKRTKLEKMKYKKRRGYKIGTEILFSYPPIPPVGDFR